MLILCKAAGYGWTTARAIIMARPSAKGTSNQALDAAFANFEKLSPSTAQRVVRFWQVRQPDEGERRPSRGLCPPENQIAGHAACAFGLGLVARAGKARPRLRASRRRVPRSRQNPASESAAPASRRHSRGYRWRSGIRRPAARSARSRRRCGPERSAASSAAASARDRDRADRTRARLACRQPGQQLGRVAVMQADVGEPALLDRCQRLGHAVDERLAADEACARMAPGLGDQVLAAAEADFQADIVRHHRTARASRPGRASDRSSASLRQQGVEQRGLARPQLMALAPAEEGAGLRLRRRFVHRGDCQKR